MNGLVHSMAPLWTLSGLIPIVTAPSGYSGAEWRGIHCGLGNGEGHCVAKTADSSRIRRTRSMVSTVYFGNCR